jgi:hypothetical protein
MTRSYMDISVQKLTDDSLKLVLGQLCEEESPYSTLEEHAILSEAWHRGLLEIVEDDEPRLVLEREEDL